MFSKLTQAIMGEAGEGQRKGGLGVFFGSILAFVLIGCVAGLTFIAKDGVAGNLKEVALATLNSIEILFGLLIVGYIGEYARDAKIGKGAKEPAG